MSKTVSIEVDEGHVPVVETLVHLLRTARGTHGTIEIHYRDGKPVDVVSGERLRIADFHKQLRATPRA